MTLHTFSEKPIIGFKMQLMQPYHIPKGCTKAENPTHALHAIGQMHTLPP